MWSVHAHQHEIVWTVIQSESAMQMLLELQPKFTGKQYLQPAVCHTQFVVQSHILDCSLHDLIGLTRRESLAST